MKEIVQDGPGRTGAKVLREVANPLPEDLFGSAELAQIIADMTEALDKEPEGVALAAPQIAVPYRIFIVRNDRTLPDTQGQTLKPEIQVYINPEIVKTSRKRARVEEGCLSTRGIYGTTSRHERVTIRARHADGSSFERGGGGLMAQIFEHETDHLNGILFIDHAEHLIRLIRESTPRFAFFGTPKVASDTLATLVAHGFIPAVVVTSPDAPRDRGHVLTPSETKVFALECGIPVSTPQKLDAETISEIRAYECDYAIVAAYGKIFPTELIETFPKGMLNVHYSLLPKHRGAIPVEAALLADDSETGVTIQTIAREVDAGDVLAQESTPISPDETAIELRARLVPMGAELLVATLPAFLSGTIKPIAQDASLASKEWRLNKEDGLLDLNAPDRENWNKYRAYADTVGTYFFENGKRMKITKASLKNNKFIIERVIPEGKNERDF